MNIADREIATPASTITVDQMNRTFLGRDTFEFDVAHHGDKELRAETFDVFGEVIDGDIYCLQHDTREGDVWVDAGCHVGLFSIAAMMAGADVSVMIDENNDSAWCAEYNARQFMRQQLIRGDHQRRRIMPTAVVERITGAEQLVQAGMLAREHWTGMERSCLKLDIQGGEVDVFGDGVRDLSTAFDFMVLEWHLPELIETMVHRLEHNGWKVGRYANATDILLGTETHIVWAHSG